MAGDRCIRCGAERHLAAPGALCWSGTEVEYGDVEMEQLSSLGWQLVVALLVLGVVVCCALVRIRSGPRL